MKREAMTSAFCSWVRRAAAGETRVVTMSEARTNLPCLQRIPAAVAEHLDIIAVISRAAHLQSQWLRLPKIAAARFGDNQTPSERKPSVVATLFFRFLQSYFGCDFTEKCTWASLPCSREVTFESVVSALCTRALLCWFLFAHTGVARCFTLCLPGGCPRVGHPNPEGHVRRRELYLSLPSSSTSLVGV